MAAVKGPGQTVPRPTMEKDWEVCQVIGSIHHVPIPSTGYPVPELPNHALESLVLVVPAMLAHALRDHDALPWCMPAVARQENAGRADLL
eukprot:1489649-Rhodomonas_salina.1